MNDILPESWGLNDQVLLKSSIPSIAEEGPVTGWQNVYSLLITYHTVTDVEESIITNSTYHHLT